MEEERCLAEKVDLSDKITLRNEKIEMIFMIYIRVVVRIILIIGLATIISTWS